MKTLRLIIPVYKDYIITLEEVKLEYPETYKLPSECVEESKLWIIENKHALSLVVVSTSPYVMESVLTYLREERKVTYSNGKDDIIAEEFWKHFADPMAKLMFDK